MLAGFMSKWIMLCSWRYSRPLQTWRVILEGGDLKKNYFGYQIISESPQLMDQWHGSAVQDVMQIVSIQSLHDYQEVVFLFGDLEGER